LRIRVRDGGAEEGNRSESMVREGMVTSGRVGWAIWRFRSLASEEANFGDSESRQTSCAGEWSAGEWGAGEWPLLTPPRTEHKSGGMGYRDLFFLSNLNARALCSFHGGVNVGRVDEGVVGVVDEHGLLHAAVAEHRRYHIVNNGHVADERERREREREERDKREQERDRERENRGREKEERENERRERKRGREERYDRWWVGEEVS
jgi:hypothetical protein